MGRRKEEEPRSDTNSLLESPKTTLTLRVSLLGQEEIAIMLSALPVDTRGDSDFDLRRDDPNFHEIISDGIISREIAEAALNADPVELFKRRPIRRLNLDLPALPRPLRKP